MKSTHKAIVALMQSGCWLTPGRYSRMYELYRAGEWKKPVKCIQRRTIEEMWELGILVMGNRFGRNTLILPPPELALQRESETGSVVGVEFEFNER